MGLYRKELGLGLPLLLGMDPVQSLQSARASLSCALAHIPFLFTNFRGFLVGLLVDGNFYKFTTINQSRAEESQNGTAITVRFENHDHILIVEYETSAADYIPLNRPRGSRMVPPLFQENLQCTVRIDLRDWAGNAQIFSATGCCAGVEYGGDQIMILD